MYELARAKINLFLHVCGKRPDGYHDLQSLAVFANAADRLEVRAADALTLAVSGPFAHAVPQDADNLVLRAAQSLQATLGIKRGAALHLTKNLPVASGIGGGSADAAAALRLLARLWEADRDLAPIALSLGSDVPVCLQSCSAWMAGRGEVLRAAKLPALHMVLLNPGVAVSTDEIFRRMRAPYSAAMDLQKVFILAEELVAWLKKQRNDLQEAAIALVPQIGAALALLNAQEGCLLARMSGSGATCFGLFTGEEAARRAQSAIRAAAGSWWMETAYVP